ncbi:hypothetical protein QQM39_42480 [Streptomyces sp. DT2A-34]|nr:hypothetical protein [Streptomyces sp. DT2A-34]MDO0917240.1 hypothetical protein [Streptomyces sp. DT2A-34]
MTSTFTTYASRVFPLETMDVPGGTETILRGGRHLFPSCRRPSPASGASA